MRKFRTGLCALLMACGVLTSCLKNDDTETILYSDAAITDFTLGTLTQTDPTTQTVTTLTGSIYKMAIDQIGFKIYNRDSLPMGTAVSSVLCTISTKNSSGVAIRQLADTTLYDWYSSTTGIDFTQPRIFYVISTDGTYHREYTVQLNVKRTPTKTFWTTEADTTALDFSHARLMAIDTMLIAFGDKGGALQVCRSKDHGKTWKTLTTNETLSIDGWKNVIAKNDTLFMLSNGTMLQSTDGEQWLQKSTGLTALSQLVGASSKELFAISADSMMMVSNDNGATWTADQIDGGLSIDSVKHMLGLEAIASTTFPYATVNNTDYVLLAGNNGSKTVVWRKISRHSNGTTTGQWINIPSESLNKYALSKQDSLSLIYIDSKVLAFGNDTIVRQSTDQGITWREETTYALPQTVLSATVDKSGVLWAIAKEGEKGKVLRGSVY